MEQHTALTAEPPDLFNRLQDPSFIVRRHDADQDRLVREGMLELIKINKAVALDREISYAAAALFQVLAGIEHGLVFSDNGDDVVSFFATSLCHAFDGQVVTLCGAGGKDDFRR